MRHLPSHFNLPALNFNSSIKFNPLAVNLKKLLLFSFEILRYPYPCHLPSILLVWKLLCRNATARAPMAISWESIFAPSIKFKRSSLFFRFFKRDLSIFSVKAFLCGREETTDSQRIVFIRLPPQAFNASNNAFKVHCAQTHRVSLLSSPHLVYYTITTTIVVVMVWA